MALVGAVISYVASFFAIRQRGSILGGDLQGDYSIRTYHFHENPKLNWTLFYFYYPLVCVIGRVATSDTPDEEIVKWARQNESVYFGDVHLLWGP